MADKDVESKVPIYKLKTTEEIMKYYDEWGTNNKYDKDMGEWDYTGPRETVDTYKKYANNKKIRLADTTNEKFVGKTTLIRADLENDTLLTGKVISLLGSETNMHTITWNNTTTGTTGSFITICAVGEDRWIILDGTTYCTGGLVTPFGT